MPKIIKQYKYIVIAMLAVFVLALSVMPAWATRHLNFDSEPKLIHQQMIDNINASALDSALEPGDNYDSFAASVKIQRVIGDIIKAFISVFGIIFLVLMVYGGYKWLVAAGREEQVTKAKDIVQSAVIGLAIVLMAYVITYYIVDVIVGAAPFSPQDNRLTPADQQQEFNDGGGFGGSGGFVP